MSTVTKLFLSYGWKDDWAFVARLYRDLIKKGFDVWWDRKCMPSRALPLTQEIRDAVDSADRLIAVVGPAAIKSEYVQAEWKYAITACKVVTPLLRIGDYSLLPPNLSKIHAPDFRKPRFFDVVKNLLQRQRPRTYRSCFRQLLRILEEPLLPIGFLSAETPALPPHFQGRPEHLEKLKNLVLADVRRPVVITSSKQTTALQGMGGIGKSVIAAVFARDCQTRRTFTDGIVWLSVGVHGDLSDLVRRAGVALRDNPVPYARVEEGKEQLRRFVENKVCLLVLDDVWEGPARKIDNAQFFVNILGPRCRLLITTRDAGLVTSLGAEHLSVDLLSDQAARKLLAEWSNQPLDKLPNEAAEVARECGNLPFSLAQCGAMVRDGNSWADLLEALRSVDLRFMEKQLPNYPYPSAFKALKVSVDALERQQSGARGLYLTLGVFPLDQGIPEQAVVTLWTHTFHLKANAAHKLVTTLHSKALVQDLRGATPNRWLVLHDLHQDYLRAHGNTRGLHEKLVAAYRAACRQGWHSGPNDGYFFQQLMFHLHEAGMEDEIRRLLIDFKWMRTKLEASDVGSLIADYDYLPDDPDVQLIKNALKFSADIVARDQNQLAGQLWSRLRSSASPDIEAMLSEAMIDHFHVTGGAEEVRKLLLDFKWMQAKLEVSDVGSLIADYDYLPDDLDVQLIKNALKLSADILARDQNQLAGQLWGRLRGSASADIQGMLSDTLRSKERAWLMPLTCSLTPPDSLTTTMDKQAHAGGVTDVVITPDGKRAISASMDHTMLVWDLINFQQVTRRLRGHESEVTGVAITPDGKLAISWLQNGMIIVWDLTFEKEPRTVSGWDLGIYPSWITALAVTPDGKHVITALEDGTVRVSQLEGKQRARMLVGHAPRVSSIAVTPDCRKVILVSYDREWEHRAMRIWDFEEGRNLGGLFGHTGAVNDVAVTGDGNHVISASDDGTLRVWELSTCRELGRLINSSGFSAVSVTLDGKFLVATSYDHTLRVWKRPSRESEWYAYHRDTASYTAEGALHACAVTADGRIILAGDNTGRLHFLKLIP